MLSSLLFLGFHGLGPQLPFSSSEYYHDPTPPLCRPSFLPIITLFEGRMTLGWRKRHGHESKKEDQDGGPQGGLGKNPREKHLIQPIAGGDVEKAQPPPRANEPGLRSQGCGQGPWARKHKTPLDVSTGAQCPLGLSSATLIYLK